MQVHICKHYKVSPSFLLVMAFYWAPGRTPTKAEHAKVSVQSRTIEQSLGCKWLLYYRGAKAFAQQRHILGDLLYVSNHFQLHRQPVWTLNI